MISSLVWLEQGSVSSMKSDNPYNLPFRAFVLLPHAAMLVAALGLSSCNSARPKVHSQAKAELDTAPKFSEVEYGVKGSPRVTELKIVPRGGGRSQVGKPYKIRGKWYTPTEDPDYAATGVASWYGPNFHGRLTANGEVYDQYALSAAHPTMPLPSYAKVTNLENGASLMVRVNDRGPYAHGRIIDLSGKAAELLGYRNAGVANVKVEYVGRARMDGHDARFLLASYRAPGAPEIVPGASEPGTMIAMAEEPDSPVIGAISAKLDAATLAFVPVPTPRPAYFTEGTPMQMASHQPPVAAVRLGFAAENPINKRIASAFAAFDQQDVSAFAPAKTKVDPQAASRSAIISLGIFNGSASAEYVKQVFSDIGVVSARNTGKNGAATIELTMLIGSDATDFVLQTARQRGLKQARVLREPVK